jgi:SAM-dependent methyltransferase
MTQEDNKIAGITPELHRIKELLATIRQESDSLATALWSPEELNAMQQNIDGLRDRMAALSQGIVTNLYWYEQIGWKKFVPNKARLRDDENEEAMNKEKERLKDWQRGVLQCSDFYLSFKDQLGTNKLVSKISDKAHFDLKQASVLDIGCGDGQWLRKLHTLGAAPEKLTGVELSEPLLEQAASLSAPDMKYIQSDPDELPFKDATFDLILVFGLLMHVLDEHLLRKVAREILRLLTDNGMILTFNFNKGAWNQLEPYLQFTTKGLELEELTGLFPDCHIDYEEMSPYGLAVIRKISFTEGN